jgi:uncharacterized protein
LVDMVNYFEVGSPDPEGSRAFYGSLFDWTFGESSPASYQMVNGDKGGLWDTSSLEGTSWAIFYVQVDDVKAAIARAESLGGSRQRRHRVRAPPGPARQPFRCVASETAALKRRDSADTCDAQ